MNNILPFRSRPTEQRARVSSDADPWLEITDDGIPFDREWSVLLHRKGEIPQFLADFDTRVEAEAFAQEWGSRRDISGRVLSCHGPGPADSISAQHEGAFDELKELVHWHLCAVVHENRETVSLEELKAVVEAAWSKLAAGWGASP